MRERTPSADDTPKRAPSAPSREADVAGSETPNDDTIEGYHTAKLSGISSASSSTSSSDRMVASTQSLEDLDVNHPANAAGSNADRQQHQQQQQQLQERYGHAYRSSAQTAQDKRSRLSNVINNLRKKVPDGTVSGNSDLPRKEEDDRNSVERNLETLEKYVMTVLNGVIKDNEEENKNAEKIKELERQRKGVDEEEEEEEEEDEEEDPTDTAVKSGSSSEGDIEAAVVPRLEDSSVENVDNTESSEITNCSSTKGTEESLQDLEVRINQDSKEPPLRMDEEHLDMEEKELLEDDRSVSREKENRTLSTIIMDRLSEHQVEERANVDDGRGNRMRDERAVSENTVVRAICGELLDDLLSEVYRTIDDHENQQKVDECKKSKKTDATESRVEETKDSSINVQELSVMGLHCSLPLDKVASVLQNCQTSESMASRLSSRSPSSPSSMQKSKPSSSITPPVRLLCLYCDRKFLSMSRRQRHMEKAHQLGGGRRSERNLRKSSQNCQYCSEKSTDTLEALFQHMVGSHGDKYHACVLCLTRYLTREALVGHMGETHGGNVERIGQFQSEKIKEGSPPCKDFCSQNPREKINMPSVRERRSEEKESKDQDDSRRSDSSRTKLIATRDPIDNPASPEFDSSFYSNVSCNIRENLLHHLDGKLQTMSGPSTCTPLIATSSLTAVTTTIESKSPQQQPQQFYEHSINQIQFPIDISLTAATPVYSKDYSGSEEYENSSEYARKAGKSSGSRPRRVSFEKYNFPRKYDGKEQWTCSIKDLSKFDISTQLSLRKKQQLIKERLTISRLRQIPLLPCEITEVSLCDQEQIEPIVETAASNQDIGVVDTSVAILDVVHYNVDVVDEPLSNEIKETTTESSAISTSSSSTNFTEFTFEFADFMRLRRREEGDDEVANAQEIVYAELSGEWSRMRIYICGACGSRHVTLKEMEDHKASTHPRVLCSHFDLAGDQREYYKHLYLPGRDAPTDAARDASLAEMVCTKCAKSCSNVGELHRHMLECGGDQAWLLGLTGSGKKKCKWRPFGSRSRRRRQRGMKRNIQNSQTQPRVINVERSKEKQAPTGPRVRPSDRESIQKMLANLPAKRATRKVLQDNMMRSQGRLRNVQTRTRPCMIGDNSSRISRNKAVLRNKLLKNAKSIQRKRCRSDNIAAVIESVVRKCHETEKKSDSNVDKSETENEGKKDAKENEGLSKATSKASDQNDRTIRPRVGRPKVLGKRRNVKNPQLQSKSGNKLAKAIGKFAKFKNSATSEKSEGEEISSPKNTPKNAKTTSRAIDKDVDDVSSDSKKMTISEQKNKNKLTQGILKKRRPVDPVASLNASLKARSQLRTQDGKFARNPNKDSVKSSEAKIDGKYKAADSIEIKPKLKATQKLKKAKSVQLPRRITRLSSDSDKMPTLEPVVQIVSSNEDYADKSANDLPILSPVTSGSLQDQKVFRISTKCVLKEKEGNIEASVETVEKNKKEQKSTRGRKPKEETKDITIRKKINITEENKTSKNNVAMLKDDKTKSKKSVPAVNINSNENSKEETKKEAIVKKDSKLKKEEATKETRSNSKTRVDKDFVKLSDIPFEVKKLLYSARCILDKDDLLNTLELASNDSKRSLRQLTPRSKMFQVNDKSPREFNDESDASKDMSKKEKVEATRKSSRKNTEKKSDDKMAKTNLEKDSASNAIAIVPQNERNQSKRDRTAKMKEIAVDNPDIKNKTDGRQTRGSLSDAKSEPSLEIASDSFRKSKCLLGKRRSRNKSIDEAEEINFREEQSNSENAASNEKELKCFKKVNDKVSKKETVNESDKNSDDRLDSTVVNINLSHLQSETSNLSIDSGKENSLETSVNIHSKLKVGRPKKTWGTRREKSSKKRSLNNVIGILTEGMNIPLEAQQNVQVLTVQTSLDNPDRVARNGSVQQPSVGEDNVIAVDSVFSELSILTKSEEESTENETITATSMTDGSHDGSENNACLDKAQVENAFADKKVDVSSKVITAKACSPANDIILDLSRRKPKGKGSFIEKIVSKITLEKFMSKTAEDKQKDALLEGEVGSLLDNAADELTSILVEVGPTLVDNVENANFDETSYVSKNDNDKTVTVTSTDEKLSAIVDPEIRVLENDKTNVENAISKRLTDSLEISNNFEENLITKTETQSENQTKIDNVSEVETKNDDDMDRKTNDAIRSAEESHIESCENKLITNKKAVIPIKIPDESPASLTDISISCSLIMTQKENLEKLEKKEGVTKSRRKSNKRSSKKSKKRSLESVENRTGEDATQKKLRLNDTLKSEVGNEFSEKDGNIMEISADIEIEKSKPFQHSESEIIKDDLKLSSLEKNLIKANESSLEKFIDLPEATSENAKLTSLEKSLDKIISEEDAVVINVRSTESSEKSVDFSILSLNKSVECEKSADRIQRKDQIDTNESSSRRTSKRKLQSVSSVTPPIDSTTNILQTPVESMDETEKIPSSSSIARESLESTDIQPVKIGTTSDSDVSLEKFLETMSGKNEETQNTDDSSLVNSMPLKTTKKHDAKKLLVEEHLELPEDESIEVISKLNDGSSITDSNERLSVSLEHFKIPEVKDLLQSAKKRSPKKKSHSEDDRWNGGSVFEESRTNEESMKIDEISDLIEEKVKEQAETKKYVTAEESSMKRLERSSSSGSIGLTPSPTKTRSMFKRKTQLSSEDLAESSIRNQSAESTDDLSESSCVSESSYFRKKRFAKKKRKEEIVDDSARPDVSLSDSMVLKSDKQNPKRKTSKTRSLLDEHLDLSDVDDIDIPMDIQASLENTEALENIEREFELAEKSLALQNENANKSTDDTENKDSYNTLERPLTNHDSPDNPVTPKKRAAGNFVVVHTKTGEILIVEKKKKLTKEAARFFCDVCATSFTRKSSLKKHTLSQSHLSQLTKSSKDKIEPINSNTFENAEEDDNEWKNQENDQKNVSENTQPHETDRKSLEPDESYVLYATNTVLTKSLVDLGTTRQMMEDKLLDEEICKITENMSHDEYVLTDHLTPEEPILSSTPIFSDEFLKKLLKKQEDSGRNKNSDKKRNKSKKRNLAEEHLILDSPELEKSKIDSNELPKSTNDIVRVFSPSCDHASTKEIMEMVEKIRDISKECVDISEIENQSELIITSSNKDLKSACDIDTTAEQQIETTRTTRRTLRKLSKVDNEGKEETSALTETNRFSLRPRRSKNFQHYEESDVEADVYFMDTSMEINSDEIEDSCDAQKRQNEVEEETNALQEKTYADTNDKNFQNAEVARSKAGSTNDTKKRKRGRPRLKDRIVPNSSIASAHNFDVNENDAVATSNLDESKIEDQKLDSCIKHRHDETGKPPYINANVQPPKRSRGRPRKNPIPIANNSSVQTNNSGGSESTKSNYDEAKEKTDVIESCSKTIIEEITSISSLIPSPAVQDPELSLSETKKDFLNAEEIRNTELKDSENRPENRTEPTDIKTDAVLIKNCENALTFNIPSEKVEISMPSETNTYTDDVKCVLEEDKHNDDMSVNVLTNLTTESSIELPSQITEQVSIDDLKSAESKVIGFDNSESFEVSKLTDVSEEKQTKSREEEVLSEVEEVSKVKLLSESEDEDEALLVTNDKSLLIASSHESQKVINDLENDSICDEKVARLELNKKLSRKSTSKERETDRKKSKTSKGKKKKIKVAELSSDSENEDDRIESAASNKSKIVKSVFGRVFGGEKADKVKEVLNDWVSRSEDDSDMSRSASDARSCLRGPTKFPENGHKKEKKCHFGKKGSDKCGSEVHGKAKNRKKREKDIESIPEDRMRSPINPVKRRHRESKIRADEKILRTFDDESPTVSDEEIKGASDQINNELNDKDKEMRRYHEKVLNKERTKDKNLTSENWESLRFDHDAHGKSKNSSHRKKQDANERSLSPSNVFKYRRRESKTRAGDRIWRAFDNEISSCLSDDQDLDETRGISKEQEIEFYESKDLNRLDSKNVRQKDDDAWKNISSIDQEQSGVHSGRGRLGKDSNNRKRQDFNVIKISKTKTNKRISRDSVNEPIPSRDQETKNETQTHNQTIRSTSESKNRSKTLIKNTAYESFVYDDSVVSKHMNKDQDNLLTHLDRSTSSRKNKKRIVEDEDWKCSNIEFDQEDDQLTEREIRKDEESAILSRSCSSLAVEESITKNQLIDLDGNSQTNRKSDDNDNDDEEEDDDNDLEQRRMSPFYVYHDISDNSIESSSNEEKEEEEEEEEDGEEEEEEEEEEDHITHEDNSKKTNPSEFSGEKIIIRSPSLGHKSDVVTIAPTDAIEDNALDVPREIESTTEPRQGKILNFDEELFVECCSRLKATSENELRGAKKIKLDHTESYHRRDDQSQGFRVNRDRWRDVESQNSLGSLLESVNQLLGEEMYNSHDRSYRTRGSERSSRSASPDASRVDNLGYEDSLDVAFEHNNKLRDKIQQRMRESENLIANTFGQKINDNDHPDDDKRDSVGNSYSSSIHEHEQLSTSVASNREQESSPHKNKMNSTLGGLHKALSNLLHSNGKHDHNGSAPMKLLAELACARAPTSTSTLPENTTNSSRNHQSVKMVAAAVAAAAAAAAAAAVTGKDTSISPKRPTKDSAITPKNSPTKKTRNPIKELFERKKEINDRKQQERSKVALVELNVQKQRKSKKSKKQQQLEFPLIRRSEYYGGLVEKKKRRDSFDRKGESERIKDVYEFDEEESQMAPTLGSVMSYRSQIDKSYETNWSRTKNIDENAVLENGKTNYVADTKLDAIINRKFQELEKFAPKTKGALKSFQSEEQQQQQRIAESITGPMDEFVERKQQRIKRPMEQGIKQSGKIRKRGKSSKKRARNAWYENDSSDEFRTAAKAEDVGVGISKSQRSCSKGKQNLFAELSTSSESEYERDDVDYMIEQQSLKSRKNSKKSLNVDEADDQRVINESDNEDQVTSDWNQVQEDAIKNDHDAAKSESEMSDHSLVIDERKMTDDARNSDDDADNQYERTFELEDLYREDSSDTETEIEENEESMTEEVKNRTGKQTSDENAILQTKITSTNMKDDYAPEMISLEEALDFLDRPENLDPKAENVRAKNNIVNGTMDEASNDEVINEEMENKCLSPAEMRDEKEEPDDDVPALPEKLSSNEKPQKESDYNLPLHVFLSRKVQESKKRKQQQLDKLREEQERILMDFQPTRRQRKCAIGKQGLLAEISSSDEELYIRDNSRKPHDHDKSRKKRESKEKKKERYLEKKHEQMIAKEQKAIEEEILREVGKRKEILAQSDDALNIDMETVVSGQIQRKKHQTKEKHKKSGDENVEENAMYINQSFLHSSQDNHNKLDRFSTVENNIENNGHSSTSPKRKRLSKSPTKSKKVSKSENGKIPTNKRSREPIAEKSKKTSASNKDSKERRSSSGKRDSDDEELKTTKSWNKVEEGVGVAIGRRKRTAALQLYYWSSSSDEEEALEPIPAPEEEEDDRQEQHGWIVGDSHKRMITMLAMEKQLKEKRRRSEDEFEPGKAKSKKHRNSTS